MSPLMAIETKVLLCLRRALFKRLMQSVHTREVYFLSWHYSISLLSVLLCLFRVGEGRACWSLGNAHTALGNHQDAIHFTEKHLEISKEVLLPGQCLLHLPI